MIARVPVRVADTCVRVWPMLVHCAVVFHWLTALPIGYI
jgi:hypothetical protein